MIRLELTRLWTYSIGSSMVIDGAVSYRARDWRVNLHLKNLTDEEYEVRGFGSDSVIPAAPFAAYVSLGFDL